MKDVATDTGAARLAAPLDGDMSHLASGVVHATVELPVHDDRCPDTGADNNIHHAAFAAPHPEVVLPQRRGLGIVLKHYRQVQALGQHLAHRDVTPAGQVGGVEDYPARVVHRARTADTQRRDRLADRQLLRQRGDARRHAFDCR
jgi:hypothetical protein